MKQVFTITITLYPNHLEPNDAERTKSITKTIPDNGRRPEHATPALYETLSVISDAIKELGFDKRDSRLGGTVAIPLSLYRLMAKSDTIKGREKCIRKLQGLQTLVVGAPAILETGGFKGFPDD